MTMKDRILEAAERRVRESGFSEMSFRELADDVGIKSASVHYHFPTKFDLGEALVERYTVQFKADLDAIDTADLWTALDGFIALYTRALVLGHSICLCAMMGAEAIGLPDSVNRNTKAFFAMNMHWLEELFEKHVGGRKPETAAMVVAALEGGMIMASASNDRAIFDRTAKAVVRSAVAPDDAVQVRG